MKAEQPEDESPDIGIGDDYRSLRGGRQIRKLCIRGRENPLHRRRVHRKLCPARSLAHGIAEKFLHLWIQLVDEQGGVASGELEAEFLPQRHADVLGARCGILVTAAAFTKG